MVDYWTGHFSITVQVHGCVNCACDFAHRLELACTIFLHVNRHIICSGQLCT